MTTPTKSELIARYGEPDDCADDGDVDNNTRANYAREALWRFAQECSSYQEADLNDVETADELAGDLICDLLHLITQLGGDPDLVIESGRNHFVCEVGLGYDD